jgi:hypothetical protein
MKNLIFIFLLLSPFLKAQSDLQVVTKIIEKNIPLQYNRTIKINGIKSKIEVRGWDKEEIKIKMSLVSKNIDRKSAENDLIYIKYSIDRTSFGCSLSNNFDGGKVSSGLSVVYELMVPNKILLDIKNNYGNISIRDINGTLSIDSEYGNIGLSSVKGSILLKSYFNDINGEDIYGNFKCVSNHSNINLSKVGDKMDIENTYGDLFINSFQNLKKLKIKSSKSDVNVITDGIEKYNYNLSTYFGEVFLPQGDKFNLTLNSDSQKRYILSSPQIVNSVVITNMYGNISVK